MMLLEYWMPMAGFEQSHEISNCGNVRKESGKLIALTNSEGYKVVTLSKDGKQRVCKVHRLVLATFKGPPPEGHVGNHLNGRKACNRLSNLEWATRKENNRHALKTGLMPCKQKLTDAEVLEILKDERSPTELAKIHNVSRGLISGIRNGHQRAHITGLAV